MAAQHPGGPPPPPPPPRLGNDGPVSRRGKTREQITKSILAMKVPTYFNNNRAWNILGYPHNAPRRAGQAGKPTLDDFTSQMRAQWKFLATYQTSRAKRARAYILDALRTFGFRSRLWKVDTQDLHIDRRFSDGTYNGLPDPGRGPRKTEENAMLYLQTPAPGPSDAEVNQADVEMQRQWRRFHRYQGNEFGLAPFAHQYGELSLVRSLYASPSQGPPAFPPYYILFVISDYFNARVIVMHPVPEACGTHGRRIIQEYGRIIQHRGLNRFDKYDGYGLDYRKGQEFYKYSYTVFGPLNLEADTQGMVSDIFLVTDDWENFEPAVRDCCPFAERPGFADDVLRQHAPRDFHRRVNEFGEDKPYDDHGAPAAHVPGDHLPRDNMEGRLNIRYHNFWEYAKNFWPIPWRIRDRDRRWPCKMARFNYVNNNDPQQVFPLHNAYNELEEEGVSGNPAFRTPGVIPDFVLTKDILDRFHAGIDIPGEMYTLPEFHLLPNPRAMRIFPSASERPMKPDSVPFRRPDPNILPEFTTNYVDYQSRVLHGPPPGFSWHKLLRQTHNYAVPDPGLDSYVPQPVAMPAYGPRDQWRFGPRPQDVERGHMQLDDPFIEFGLKEVEWGCASGGQEVVKALLRRDVEDEKEGGMPFSEMADWPDAREALLGEAREVQEGVEGKTRGMTTMMLLGTDEEAPHLLVALT
ncbi:hypothetical protein QBC34DRAFT_479799 [Podospora aff. communis PSN243]|uniref:Uncharacterized protein n=1 Tax=Podospora aff. communis PSN243 TaxID=3040156 RepID=A0AAV9G4F4_9PEZI|nr:hypothetical protein QBC34DRAFT_479799 [Podospora aff. communis PSN243]